MQNEKVVVAGDYDFSTGGHRELQVLVVLLVTAVGYLESGFDPDRRIRDQCNHNVSVFIAQRICELGTSQHAAYLCHHRRRESYHILPTGFQDSLPRLAVSLQSGSNDNAGVKDDQRRRSAL
jgi:hypothetical protein